MENFLRSLDRRHWITTSTWDKAKAESITFSAKKFSLLPCRRTQPLISMRKSEDTGWWERRISRNEKFLESRSSLGGRHNSRRWRRPSPRRWLQRNVRNSGMIRQSARPPWWIRWGPAFPSSWRQWWWPRGQDFLNQSQIVQSSGTSWMAKNKKLRSVWEMHERNFNMRQKRFYPKGGGRARSTGKSINVVPSVTAKKTAPQEAAKGKGKSCRSRREKSDGNHRTTRLWNDGSKTQTFLDVPFWILVLPRLWNFVFLGRLMEKRWVLCQASLQVTLLSWLEMIIWFPGVVPSICECRLEIPSRGMDANC